MNEGVSPKVAVKNVQQFLDKGELQKAKEFISNCEFGKVKDDKDAELIAEFWKLRDLVNARVLKESNKEMETNDQFKTYEEAQEYFDQLKDKAKILSVEFPKGSGEFKQLAFYKPEITLKEQKDFDKKFIDGEIKANTDFFPKPKKENLLNNFIWDEEKVLQKKNFPIDLHKDIFYYGLLLPKTADNKSRDGKVYGKMQISVPCLITSKGEFLEVNERMKEDLNVYFGDLPSYLPHRWRLDHVEKYLTGKCKKINGKDLLEKISKKYEEYLAIRNNVWYDVYAIWDIGTYMYALFEAYPLIENRGIAGTGKSKSMTISSFISFNGGQVMVNPTESTLFRETEEVKGTKYFDEAEKLWVYNKSTKQYEGDQRTELINASYTKEAKVPRQEKENNKFVTKWYSPYSPTQLSSINGLYGATEDRAITRITTKSQNDDPRGEKEPTEDRNNFIWEEIRNDCYVFALQNWKEIKQIYNNFPKDCGLKRRDLQIWKPLLSIIKFISKEKYEKVLGFALELTKRKVGDLIQESSFDYMCLNALKEVIEKNPEKSIIYVNHIKFAFCNAKGDEDGKKNIYLNRNISNKLDGLGFKELRDKDRNGSYFAVTKKTFNEIISPICPVLAFSSSPSSPSSHLLIKQDNNCDDDVMMSDDRIKQKCDDVAINDDKYDRNKKKHDEKDQDKSAKIDEELSKFSDEEIKQTGYSREQLKSMMEAKQ